MRESKTVNDILLERLAEGLDSTSRMTQSLINELKESESDFAAVKTELGILRDNVKSLNNIVREGNGTASILTKIALIERQLQEIEKWTSEHSGTHQKTKNDISHLREKLIEVDRKIDYLTKDVESIFYKIDEEERKRRESVNREEELAHTAKKSKIELLKEREQAVIKFGLAFLLTILALVSGYLAKSCEVTPYIQKDVESPRISVASSSSSQK
jgi:chromosome segregation ATPase